MNLPELVCRASGSHEWPRRVQDCGTDQTHMIEYRDSDDVTASLTDVCEKCGTTRVRRICLKPGEGRWEITEGVYIAQEIIPPLA